MISTLSRTKTDEVAQHQENALSIEAQVQAEVVVRANLMRTISERDAQSDSYPNIQ